MYISKLSKALVVSVLLAITGAAAQVANFPSRPIKIVVPTSAGSGSDTTARYFGEQLGGALGKVAT